MTLMTSDCTPHQVFALHSSDGSVLWSRRLPPLAPGEPPPALPYLLVCRGGVHPQVDVVAQGEAAVAVQVLSPSSGKMLPVAAPSGAGRIVHAVKLERLASDDGSTRAPVLLVDENLMVHLYPDTAEVQSPLIALDCIR